MAGTLISKYPKAPISSDVIIKQHHGVPHGVGFAETYAANLSPMAIVFILAEDFCDDMIRLGKDFNQAAKIQQMKERYSTQRFQKIIEIMSTL